jgi:AcrR family transcriptional regulator
VEAGVALADREGLDAVSIRRVALKLEASPMALYHYVPSKRDLLNLMMDATYGEFEIGADMKKDWRALLHHFAWESRRCLQRHPWLAALRVTDPEYGPRCIETLEELLASLAGFGLETRVAVRLLGTLFVFVNGFVAAEGIGTASSRSHGSGRKSPQQPHFSSAVLETGKFPRVVRFVELGAELPDDEAFERALDWMLSGMARDIPGPALLPNGAKAKRTR